MYLNRFFRLTPLLGASILMTMLIRFLGTGGPFWPFAIDHLVGTCGRYWWSTLFYVQNYANQDALVSLNVNETLNSNIKFKRLIIFQYF